MSKEISAYICDAPEEVPKGFGHCNGICERCKYGKAEYRRKKADVKSKNSSNQRV
ncbi:MAG: hypothetical protein J6Y02_01230 [Pseudobutyrivibrio sp.]|nr:hypothetical protein [Pseudobutyrivibrio sp.]